jgi:ABC-type glutathione transport system ATPase component
MTIIETHELRKSFKTRRGPVEAVRGVDLRVAEGEIFGFLGPNGAGKTTTGLRGDGSAGAAGDLVGGALVPTGDGVRIED